MASVLKPVPTGPRCRLPKVIHSPTAIILSVPAAASPYQGSTCVTVTGAASASAGTATESVVSVFPCGNLFHQEVGRYACVSFG